MGGISAMKHPNKKVERKNRWRAYVQLIINSEKPIHKILKFRIK